MLIDWEIIKTIDYPIPSGHPKHLHLQPIQCVYLSIYYENDIYVCTTYSIKYTYYIYYIHNKNSFTRRGFESEREFGVLKLEKGKEGADVNIVYSCMKSSQS